MRILITPNGGKELIELRNEPINSSFITEKKYTKLIKKVKRSSSVCPKRTTQSSSNSITNNSTVKESLHSEIKRQNKISLKKILNKSLEQDLDPEKIQLNKTHFIEINKNKLDPIYEKDLSSDPSEAMKKLKKFLQPRRDAMKASFQMMIMNKMYKPLPVKTKVSVKEIVQEAAYEKLLNSFIKEKEIKRKNYVMSNKEFRTTLEESKKKKLDEFLQKEINSKRTDFIKYIQNKKSINMVFLDNISKMDDSKITKMNKICQLLRDNEEKNMLKRKLKEKQEREKKINFPDEWNKTAIEIQNEFKLTKEILSRPYSQIKDNSKKLMTYHLEHTGNYWHKNNIDHLQRPIHNFKNSFC